MTVSKRKNPTFLQILLEGLHLQQERALKHNTRKRSHLLVLNRHPQQIPDVSSQQARCCLKCFHASPPKPSRQIPPRATHSLGEADASPSPPPRSKQTHSSRDAQVSCQKGQQPDLGKEQNTDSPASQLCHLVLLHSKGPRSHHPALLAIKQRLQRWPPPRTASQPYPALRLSPAGLTYLYSSLG